jgi:putative MFS transporter
VASDQPVANVPYEDAPFCATHFRAVLGSTCGYLSDGYILGVVGVSLSAAATSLHLSPLWLGALGGASLAGLFLGALLAGPIADRFGRRVIYAYNMPAFCLISSLQYFVESAGQLLVLRLLLGLLLGADYVVCKALVSEWIPSRLRGRTLSVLAVSWASGYFLAYAVSFALENVGPDAWRWMLVTSALPALIAVPIRYGVPESPLWLVRRGQIDRAMRIIRDKLGYGVDPPKVTPTAAGTNSWSDLFASKLRRRTIVGCTFYTCQVIPYFAMSTFIPEVLVALQVKTSYAGGLIYNMCLLGGTIIGLVIVDRLSRRSFLVGSFCIAGCAMLLLVVVPGLPPEAILLCFAIFASALAAGSNLTYVYLPELFPTELRASGIGAAVAASRIGSVLSTFLLPACVSNYGVRPALLICVVALGIGMLVTAIWAPETGPLRAPVTRLGVVAS